MNLYAKGYKGYNIQEKLYYYRIVRDEKNKYRPMKYRVDDLHAVRLEPNIPDKMDVELLYVAVLDFSDIFHAYLIADILSVHILVVCPC